MSEYREQSPTFLFSPDDARSVLGGRDGTGGSACRGKEQREGGAPLFVPGRLGDPSRGGCPASKFNTAGSRIGGCDGGGAGRRGWKELFGVEAFWVSWSIEGHRLPFFFAQLAQGTSWREWAMEGPMPRKAVRRVVKEECLCFRPFR